MKFNTLKIKNIRKETSDAISVVFDIPEELKMTYKHIAGQYVTLKIEIDGKEVRRAYSICSPSNSDLKVLIKKVKNGVFSTYANTKFQINDSIEVSLPEGNFKLTPSSNKQKNYLAFAAGSGITPIISMIREVLLYEPNSKFVLLYGSKSPENTIFYDELNELQKEYSRLTIYYTFSQNSSGELFRRIDDEKISYILNNKQALITFDQFYICGPELMINSIIENLKNRSIKDLQIQYELFTTANHPKEIVKGFDGTCNVTIVLDDEEYYLKTSKNETILDVALKNDLNPPYSCQGGVCSSCICHVSNGASKMLQNNILTDQEINNGLTLACQTIPMSENLRVDFDNV